MGKYKYIVVNGKEKQNRSIVYKKNNLFQQLLIVTRDKRLLFQKQYSSLQLLLRVIINILLPQFTVYITSTVIFPFLLKHGQIANLLL